MCRRDELTKRRTSYGISRYSSPALYRKVLEGHRSQSRSLHSPALSLILILVLACDGETMSRISYPDWKACDPGNARITGEFVDCDPAWYDGAEVVFMPFEREALTFHQGFRYSTLGDRLEWGRPGRVALQNL